MDGEVDEVMDGTKDGTWMATKQGSVKIYNISQGAER